MQDLNYFSQVGVFHFLLQKENRKKLVGATDHHAVVDAGEEGQGRPGPRPANTGEELGM